MEMEIQSSSETLLERLTVRLAGAVERLEQTLAREPVGSATVGPIVAMVEGGREAELAQRLTEAEKTIAELRASAGSHEGRRTVPVSLLAKQEGGISDAGAIDAALAGLSLEQRIAVKSRLIRAGLV